MLVANIVSASACGFAAGKMQFACSLGPQAGSGDVGSLGFRNLGSLGLRDLGIWGLWGSGFRGLGI